MQNAGFFKSGHGDNLGLREMGKGEYIRSERWWGESKRRSALYIFIFPSLLSLGQ